MQIISVVGPTAVGKTFLSIKLAKIFNSEIISCDARQFYKELQIGTNLPSKEDMNLITHHFIAHKSIHNNYNVVKFEKDALEKLKELFQRYSLVIMVGGSCLYEKAVTTGIHYSPPC